MWLITYHRIHLGNLTAEVQLVFQQAEAQLACLQDVQQVHPHDDGYHHVGCFYHQEKHLSYKPHAASHSYLCYCIVYRFSASH